MLGYAYYRVSVDVAGLEVVTLMRMIVYGIIATFLLFWSLSGFVLRITSVTWLGSTTGSMPA